MLTNSRICPNCQSDDLRRSWLGMVVVLNPQESALSRTMELLKPGKYALKVP
jgi:DNA-directed RNA polymerase subunit E"